MGFSKVPCKPSEPECDKELLKLLPELKRIRRSELEQILSLDPVVMQMAAEKGIGKKPLPSWSRFLAIVKLVLFVCLLLTCRCYLYTVHKQLTYVGFATDIYVDEFETLPQQYWACLRVADNLAHFIKRLETCKAQQGEHTAHTVPVVLQHRALLPPKFCSCTDP